MRVVAGVHFINNRGKITHIFFRRNEYYLHEAEHKVATGTRTPTLPKRNHKLFIVKSHNIHIKSGHRLVHV